ncbi:MAG: PfkB family carbohydrate kinase [Granulosicoccus sp.]
MKIEKTHDQRLFVAGGLHIDELATVCGAVHMHASNPVSWQHFVGGAAANAAQAMRRVQAGKTDVVFAAAVGTDNHAQMLTEGLFQTGVQVFEQIVENKNTGRYSAIMDAHGKLLLGLADTSMAELLRAEFVNELISRFQPAGTLLDTNLSVPCLSGICKCCEASGIPLGVVAVSPAKAPRVSALATRITVLYCNRGEAEALTESPPSTPVYDMCDKLAALGFSRFVLTDGPRDVVVQTPATRDVLPVLSKGAPKTVNGPGDALAGASFARWISGMSLLEAVQNYGLPEALGITSGATSIARLRSSVAFGTTS